MGDVYIDELAVYELLNGLDGPVARFMEELSERAALVARGTVPVRRIASRSARSTAFPPGFTLASIRSDVVWRNGLVYGGVAAAYEPTIFLEYPAEQMETEYPFITTGIWSLEGTI